MIEFLNGAGLRKAASQPQRGWGNPAESPAR